jgi:hypothetical protein
MQARTPSLPFEQASPARLADLIPGHWAIQIAAALRRNARDATRPLALVGTTSP